MFKLTLAGISAQIAAVVMVLHAGNSLALLLSCLLLQGTAAALIGLAAWRLLPRRYRVPFVWTYGYLVALCFFVPVAGCLLVLGSLLLGKLFPKPEGDKDIADVGLPVFVAHLISRVTHGGGARLRAQRDLGVRFINIQLLDHDTPPAVAAPLAVKLVREGAALGLAVHIETHRDTATEVLAIQRLSNDGSIAKSSSVKILETNPSKLYAL